MSFRLIKCSKVRAQRGHTSRRCASKAGTQVVSVHGDIKFRAFNNKEFLFLYEEIFRDRCYLPEGFVELQPGQLVLDIGANVGLFALQAAEAGAHVIAVEALPPTFQVLQHNMAAIRSTHPAPVIALNLAVCSTDGGTIPMTFYPKASGWGTMSPELHEARMHADLGVFITSVIDDTSSQLGKSWLAGLARFLKRTLGGVFPWIVGLYSGWMMTGRRTYSVQGVSMHTLMQRPDCQGQVSLLKVDVEGAEMLVLAGMREDDWERVAAVVVEVHSRALLEQVASVLRGRYRTVTVKQDKNIVGGGLHLVYACAQKRPVAN